MSMTDFEKAVRGVELFSRFDERELELLSAQSVVKRFSHSQIVFFEDEDSPYWYFVASGRLKAYKTDKNEHNISLCQLTPPMAVNDIRVTKNGFEGTMFATIEGMSEGMLLGLKVAALPLLFAQIRAFPTICMQAALYSIERYQRAFYSGMILDGTGKVAFMLSQDLERFNAMKKQDIAAILNIQPETLSRILGKLSRKGIIEIGSDIKVTDTESLKELYE